MTMMITWVKISPALACTSAITAKMWPNPGFCTSTYFTSFSPDFYQGVGSSPWCQIVRFYFIWCQIFLEFCQGTKRFEKYLHSTPHRARQHGKGFDFHIFPNKFSVAGQGKMIFVSDKEYIGDQEKREIWIFWFFLKTWKLEFFNHTLKHSNGNEGLQSRGGWSKFNFGKNMF